MRNQPFFSPHWALWGLQDLNLLPRRCSRRAHWCAPPLSLNPKEINPSAGRSKTFRGYFSHTLPLMYTQGVLGSFAGYSRQWWIRLANDPVYLSLTERHFVAVIASLYKSGWLTCPHGTSNLRQLSPSTSFQGVQGFEPARLVLRSWVAAFDHSANPYELFLVLQGRYSLN